MYTLGVGSYVHDACAALVKDGQIIAAAEEERFNRQKHTGEFPVHAISYCLKEGGITFKELDNIAFYAKPILYTWMILDRIRYLPKSLISFNGPSVGYINSFLNLKKDIIKNFPEAASSRPRIFHIPHHLCHAASAFLVSPFEEAAILSIDASGEWASTQFSVGRGNRIEVIKEINFPHSLGVLYSAATQYLGFRKDNCEGKIMGLSSYGKPAYMDVFREMVKANSHGEFRLDLSYFEHMYGAPIWYSQKWEKIFGPARVWGTEIEKRHEDIAASLQLRLEEVCKNLTDYLYERTGLENLCLCGGVALNSVMNGKILRYGPYKNIFIQPAAGDNGAALGAALWLDNRINKDSQRHIQKTAYLGPSYTGEEIESALKKNNLHYTYDRQIAKTAARLLAEGKIIGWFQGRMEIGPRALGNRSILADPRDPDMKDILNKRVKHREGFRPFAPSVMEEYCGEYFDSGYPSPFMLLVYDVLPEKRNAVPAITHVDGTGRVQTVNREENPLYWELIDEFRKVTGIPMLLNTSFNIRGEPIVNSPSDAIACYLGTEIDYLIMGNFITKKGD